MRIVGATPKPSGIDELLSPRLAAQLSALDVRSAKVFAGRLQGERRSKKRGQSVEFDEHKVYTPGDDVRFIDWNVYARLDELVIKLFLEEEDLALHVVVDASASMDAGLTEKGARSKRSVAAEAAMALAYIGLMKQNRVGVTVFGGAGGMKRSGEMRGRRHIQTVAGFLIDHAFGETAGAGGSVMDVGTALTRIAAERVGKGVLVVLSDFLDRGSNEAGLRALSTAGGYDVYCVQVLSPGELDPETLSADGSLGLSGDVRLTDAETGATKEATVTAELMKRYRAAIAAHIEGLRRFCLAREMDHVLMTTDQRVDRLVLETLRVRGAVG